MNILLVSSEIAPLAKTGGLADVCGTFPKALRQRGMEIALAMPKYKGVGIQGTKLGEIDIQIGNATVVGHIEKTTLPDTEIPLFLICNASYYEREQLYTVNGKDYPDNLARYTFLCKAVLRMIKRDWVQPQLIHANDWQTALLPVFIKTLYRRFDSIKHIKTLLTIHNLAYQGVFPQEQLPITNIGWEHFHMEELEFYNQINLMKGGIVFADAISTVSRTYAKEIQTKEFGCGLEGILQRNAARLKGILNGVEYTEWSPEHDTKITTPYDRFTYKEGKAQNKKTILQEFGMHHSSTRKPLLGVVSRLVEQKGLDLLAKILPALIEKGAQVIVLGTGDPEIEVQLSALHQQHPRDFGLIIDFNDRLAHLIEAGSDIFLMPSRFEPCGLNQMYSLRYGTIPVVRATGGLADTITDLSIEPDEGNGFSFLAADPDAFLDACLRAMRHYENEAEWDTLIPRVMQQDYSWDKPTEAYIQCYQDLLNETN